MSNKGTLVPAAANDGKCSFCQKANAAVAVNTSGALLQRNVCLAHYYTTNAVRKNTKSFKVISYDEVGKQLKEVQSIFAEAFVELQKEIAETLARDDSIDPLSVLTKKGSSLKGRKKRSSFARDLAKGNVVQLKSTYDENEETKSGGFFKQKVVLDKLVALERNQAKHLREKPLTNFSDESANIDTQNKKKLKSNNNAGQLYNPYSRRKVKRVSYWNIGDNDLDQDLETTGETDFQCDVFQKVCTCGSNDVHIEGNMIGRNDIAKGETWGNKEKPDIFERCRCNRCGKIWNEE